MLSESKPPVIQIQLSRRRLVFLVLFLILLGVAGVGYKLHWYQKGLAYYQRAAVTIKVKESDTFALDGAMVTLNGQTYTSDSNGRLTPTNLEVGDYPISLSKPGYDPLQTTLSLKRGQNDLQIFSLKRQPIPLYAVKGFVQDYVSGQPLVDVQVTLGSKTVATDPSGAYDFEQLPAGPAQVHLAKLGYQNKDLSLVIDKQDVVTAQVPLLPTGQLVFSSNRDGKRLLYTTAYDGSASHQLIADTTGEDYGASLSPDGKYLTFSSTRDKQKDNYGNDLAELYLAFADGTGVSKVSPDVSSYLSPVWSPNSQYLYYSAYTDKQQSQATNRIFSFAKRSLLDIGENAQGLIFSPDSTLIAYTVTGPDPSTGVTLNFLKTFNLATGERKTITQQADYLSNFQFSLDTKTLSYEVVLQSVRRRFAVTLSTSTQAEVPVPAATRVQYVISPDSTLRAFIDLRDGKSNLFIQKLDGTSEKQLTTLGVLDSGGPLQWDSSGRYLTFAVHREGEDALYIVALSGGDPKKVTDYFAGHP